MSNFVKSWIVKYPVKLGLALQNFGHYLMGISAVSYISGNHATVMEVAIIVGFFMVGIGQFISTLFTNGRSVDIAAPVVAQTTVQTTLQSAKSVDIPLKTEVTATP
jgi:mannose/fructose/N-acetylgalactosamine-specific phosphotransferase system component IID